MALVVVEVISQTPAEEDEETGEMDEAEEVVGVAFVTDEQAAGVAEPGKEPLDLPAASVPAELAAVLRLELATVAAMGSDHLNALRR